MVSGEHLFLGVDVGGTKVAAGLVNSAAEVMLTARMPMVTRKSAEDGLRAVLDAIDEVLSGKPEEVAQTWVELILPLVLPSVVYLLCDRL